MDDAEMSLKSDRVPLKSEGPASNRSIGSQELGSFRSSTLSIPPRKRKSFCEWVGFRAPKNVWRTIATGTNGKFDPSGYPPNVVNNCRYSVITFLPKATLEQFKLFFNIYFLAVAISQFIPVLKVGFIFVYFAPLAFVVALSLAKEAWDDLQRWRRDCRANAEEYEVLCPGGRTRRIPAKEIRVGDLLVLHARQRIPADCLLLHTTEKSGASFVRTDQLDGETDWKLRFPLKPTEKMHYTELSLFRMNLKCEPLHQDIYKFVGGYELPGQEPGGCGLENTLWANCVLASGTVVGVVIHTGAETRSAMNASKARSKRGLLDDELNVISFMCFILLMILSFLLVCQQEFQGNWFINFFRFQILMAAIIPISMRVNIDVARMWYAYVMSTDKKSEGTLVRNTNIPEELGRLQYLFSDKTGTLTKNIMEFRFLQLGPHFVLQHRDKDDFVQALQRFFGGEKKRGDIVGYSQQEITKIGNAVLGLALCHNVTPVKEADRIVEYQASSPDEVAMVKFAASVGVTLHERTVQEIDLEVLGLKRLRFEVVKIFPFSSDRKCMGIILRDSQKNCQFLMKGADTKMAKVLSKCDWLEEGCQEMALKGLRTLVFAQRSLTQEEVDNFFVAYERAGAVLSESGRQEATENAMRMLEAGMNLVAITGVEDQLQDEVENSLETLGFSGIRVWMLTGDKVETATCIGRSARLIPRSADVEYLLSRTHEDCLAQIRRLRDVYCGSTSSAADYLMRKWILVLDGTCLGLCFSQPDIEPEFIELASSADSVIVARCSPTQKAEVVKAMQRYKGNSVRTAAIGDGGNDVSMILAAHVGIGVEGLEGKQASLAADFSITKFNQCLRLILWHGRNSYKRSARLSQFIMHRGIVYAIVQACFSMTFGGSTMSVFNGYLVMGYSTIFTMAPVFALVLDEDYREDAINEFPQLYAELLKGRSMNARSFLTWVWVSFFQGGVMMYLTLRLMGDELFQVVSIVFSTLLLTELVICAATVHHRILWRQRRLHFKLFALSELASIGMFFLSVLFLPDTFDQQFFFSWRFAKIVFIIAGASIGPIFILWIIKEFVIFKHRARVK